MNQDSQLIKPFFATFLLISYLLACDVIYSQEAVEVFQGPKPVEMVSPRYPQSAAMRNEEGLVLINVMIDEGGKPYEPVVIDSSGNDFFREAALRAMEDSIFEPATDDGVPVDSSITYLYRFILDQDNPGARSQFVRRYRTFIDRMQSYTSDFNRSAVESRIQSAYERLLKVEAKNHYENAFLSFAEFLYAQQYGSEVEQVGHLRSALSFTTSGEDGNLYLSDENAMAARRILFNLEVKNYYFTEALDTFGEMKKRNDDEGVGLFQSTYEELLRLKGAETSYSIPASLSQFGTWHIDLFKNNFYFDNVDGVVSEVKLRCDKKFVIIPIDLELSYAIADEWGDCSMEVLGEAATTFEIVQHG